MNSMLEIRYRKTKDPFRSLTLLGCVGVALLAAVSSFADTVSCKLNLFPPFAVTPFPEGAIDLSYYRATSAEIREYRAKYMQDALGYITEPTGFSGDYTKLLGNSPNTTGVTPEEFFSMFQYKIGYRGGNVEFGNYSWNEALGEVSRKKIAERQIQIKVLASGLNKLPGYNGTTYRTIHLPQKILKKYQPDQLIYEPTFVSTSKVNSRDLKYQSANVLYEIHLKGRGGHDIDFEKDMESEVLVSPNVPFLVKSRSKIKVPAAYRGGSSRTVDFIVLEEVLIPELPH